MIAATHIEPVPAVDALLALGEGRLFISRSYRGSDISSSLSLGFCSKPTLSIETGSRRPRMGAGRQPRTIGSPVPVSGSEPTASQ
jgi:hypothetical protein